MPTFNFECNSCGHKQQKSVSILYPKLSKCPKCLMYTLIKLIGSGASFNLKGKGFYKKGIQ